MSLPATPTARCARRTLSVARGQFAFITSRGGDNLTIDTPFARIRGTANGGAIGVLTLVALTFVLMQDLRADTPNFEFVLDDLISYKDMEHGTFQLVIKGPAPRVITVDNPEVSVVVSPTGVEQVVNTAADMAALLAASQDAHATYSAGQADPLTTGSVGGTRASLGSGDFVEPIQVALGQEPPPPPRGGEQLPAIVPTFPEDTPVTTPVPVIAASIGSGSLTVSESDLDVVGSTPGGNGETSTSTGLSFVSGDKAIALSFAANQNPTVSGLDEGASISWTLDPADPTGRTLLGTIGGVPVIKLTLTGDLTAAANGDIATPTITAVLIGLLPHQDAPDADSLTITGLVVNATDADGQIISGTIDCNGAGRRAGCS